MEGRVGPPGSVADRRRARDRAASADQHVLTVAARVLGEIRKAKSDAKKSMRVDVSSVVVTGGPEDLAALQAAIDDVKAAGRVAELSMVETAGGTPLTVDVTLAEA